MTPEKIAASGTEHGIQAAFFASLVSYYEMYPELMLMFAIPNGGQRNPATAGRLKAEGVKAGVPDTFLPVARLEFNGLFIEFKKVGGKTSPAQNEMILRLRRQKYKVEICYDWLAAQEIVLDYLSA